MKTTQSDPATHPALAAERHRMLESRLKAVQSVPTRFCNSTSQALYTGLSMVAARPGADAFLGVKSRGWA